MENANLHTKKLPKFCQLHYPTDLKRPHTLITPKMLKTALPTMVPIPRSLLVTKVPIILVKNSGALVPVMKSYETVNFLSNVAINSMKSFLNDHACFHFYYDSEFLL